MRQEFPDGLVLSVSPWVVRRLTRLPGKVARFSTPSGWSCVSQDRIRWVLAHPRQFVQGVFSMTIIRNAA